MEKSDTHPDAGIFRDTFFIFLNKQLQERITEGKKPQSELISLYRPENWLVEAAKKVKQLRLVTHTPKYNHPKIDLEPTVKGVASSLLDGGKNHPTDLVATYGEKPAKDFVGNAAALGEIAQDVAKLLSEDCQGTNFLTIIQEHRHFVERALHEDEELTRSFFDAVIAFSSYVPPPASHTLAKQVYFPLEDGDYHLLAPLYPTSLVHRLFQVINHDRFSEDAKSAREARRSQKPGTGYREHLNLAVQSFGGTKPQNISQLNSERGGRAYLLASLPPTWKDQGMKPPLTQRTLFGRWLLSRRDLGASINMLKKFLAGTQHNNLPIREARSRMVNYIVDQVLGLAFTVQSLPAGWSANSECRLNRAECLWLDPGRCDDDPDFAAERQLGDWKENTAAHFGRWLNQLIRSDQAPLDSAAARHWENDFADAMQTFERGMP